MDMLWCGGARTHRRTCREEHEERGPCSAQELAQACAQVAPPAAHALCSRALHGTSPHPAQRKQPR
eukprot:5268169-Prymnesium_polylepis.1